MRDLIKHDALLWLVGFQQLWLVQDRIKEHDRDIRFARTETSAVSEHAHNTAQGNK